MIKTIIIDDEKHAISGLKYELSMNCPQVAVIGETTDPKEGIHLVQELKPNLIFLDIEMPTMNGFELLKNISGKIDFDVIFVTAYDQYAIKAFKFSAVDYLLKPVNSNELKDAIRLLEKRKYSFNNEHFEALLSNISKKNNTLEKIVLPTSKGLEFIEVKQIIRCESDSNYCKVFLTNNEFLFLAKTLKEIESILFEYGFYRIHNSHLIALDHIARYQNIDGGVIEMKDGTSIPVARSKKNEFLKRFKLN